MKQHLVTEGLERIRVNEYSHPYSIMANIKVDAIPSKFILYAYVLDSKTIVSKIVRIKKEGHLFWRRLVEITTEKRDSIPVKLRGNILEEREIEGILFTDVWGEVHQTFLYQKRSCNVCLESLDGHWFISATSAMSEWNNLLMEQDK